MSVNASPVMFLSVRSSVCLSQSHLYIAPKPPNLSSNFFSCLRDPTGFYPDAFWERKNYKSPTYYRRDRKLVA